ncbi:hypothetical protein E2542_SST10508 [Spatholobus suberectus]|nr:hypothetical protein E2542_SST10508 [Spatholobus suberectus]
MIITLSSPFPQQQESASSSSHMISSSPSHRQRRFPLTVTQTLVSLFPTTTRAPYQVVELHTVGVTPVLDAVRA